MPDEIMTVYLNDGTEAAFKNHDAQIIEGVLILTSEDKMEKIMYPLASIHHTVTGVA